MEEYETATLLEELWQALDYDSVSGIFTWRINGEKPPYNRPTAGAVAGTMTHGRTVIRWKGRGYFAARIAWAFENGEWPTYEVDHEDRNKRNDSANNLRDLTRSENCLNKEQTDKRIAAGKPERTRLQIVRNKYHPG